MNIDDILSNASCDIFSQLEKGEKLIIKIISKHGPLNATQIGKITTKRAVGFHRWGVKDRIEGSSSFKGLTKADYLYKIKKNRKETQYGLTLKGLFASVNGFGFDNNYLIKKYIAQSIKTIDVKITKWLINYIKYEIGLLLYFVNIQGLDWTWFKQIRLYIHNLKQNSDQILIPFYFSRRSLTPSEREEFDFIKDEYLGLVMIIKLIRTLYQETQEDFSDYEYFKSQSQKRKIDELISEIVNRWYINLDGYSQSLDEDVYNSIILKDPYFKSSKWLEKEIKKFGKINDFLHSEGYKVKSSSIPI